MSIGARRLSAVVVVLLVAGACASASEDESMIPSAAPSGSTTIDARGVFSIGPDADGTLDCRQGQIVRASDVDVSGATRILVAVQALEEWTTRGAILWDLPSLELWSAVLDGEDVAIAFPEFNGDGTWVVHDVQTCGEPDSGPAGLDGYLDCANDTSWGMIGTPDPTFVGLATAEDAVRFSLEWYADRYGGEIVMTGAGAGALVVDRREQVIARSVEFPAGGWGISAVLGCDGYEFVR